MATKKSDTKRAALSEVPEYILEHAPLLHLFSAERYRPSSIAAQLTNTRPEIDFKSVSIPQSQLTLENLGELNSVGAKGGKDVYLTSNDDITTDPKWLEGVQVDANRGTGDEKTAVIIVVDKGDGIVDAFYFYFFAFNWGGVVLSKQLGDHVGDWEHNMIRFINGVPTYIWLSQHSNGEAYTFSAMQKDPSGKRPICYCANGSHALYPLPGTHDHTIPNLNLPTPFLLVDETDAGPIFDPTLSSHIYAYTPSPDTFTALSLGAPTSFLTFTGRWGDAEYPADDKRQKGKGLFSFKKYVGGPTGPVDKQLGRKDVWPENSDSKGQRVRRSLDGKTWWRDLIGGMSCFGKGKGKGVTRVKVSGEEV